MFYAKKISEPILLQKTGYLAKFATLLLFTFCFSFAAHAQGNIIVPAPPTQQEIAHSNWLRETSDAGDVLLKNHQWNAAVQKFQSILAQDHYYGYTYYGLAQAYIGQGYWKQAATNFHILYTGIKDESGKHSFYVDEPTASMDYAITLTHLGQAEEAVTVYNKAVNKLNYQDYDTTHKPYLEVLFPLFDPDGPLYYSPKLLQSLAHVVRGFHNGEDKEKEADFREAMRLDPRSAVAYYYLGRLLEGDYPRRAEARAAYIKASQLGSGTMLEVIQKKFKALPKD